MTCDEARALLLEAEPEELKGTGGSPLSLHLSACPRCAAAAARVLEATRELDAHLATASHGSGVDAVLARLADAGTLGGEGLHGRPQRRWGPAVWGSLALAAAAAGLVFVTRTPAPMHEGTPRTTASAPPLPLVEASNAATVAVIQTDNPDITVLWFF
jgi:hypothetical protein